MQALAITVAVLTGLLLVWVALTYNTLVHARSKVIEAHSGIAIHLRQRHDLVPNLVEVTRAYAAHERTLFERTVSARGAAIAAATANEIEAAETDLSAGLRPLIAIAESYPELTASRQFRKLMLELRDVEDELRAARGLYNQNVRFFNIKAESFPTLLMANRMKQQSYPFFNFDLAVDDAGAAGAAEVDARTATIPAT